MTYREVLGWKDLFTELSFKPWWESFRSYTFVIISASTLFYALKSSVGLIACLPSTNGTASLPGPTDENVGFGSAEEEFVNLKCLSSLPQSWFLINFWWLSILATGLLFIANNFWEYITPFVTSIKALKYFFDKFAQCKYREVVNMSDFVTTPYKQGEFEPSDSVYDGKNEGRLKERNSKQEVTKVRKLWKEIFQIEKNSNNIVRWYRVRNGISFTVALIYAGLMAMLFTFLLQLTSQFDCVIGKTGFVCLYTSQNIIMPVVVTHLTMSSVQCFIFVIATLKYEGLDNIELFLRIMKQSGIHDSLSHKRVTAIHRWFKEAKDKLRKMDSSSDNVDNDTGFKDAEFLEIHKMVKDDHKERKSSKDSDSEPLKNASGEISVADQYKNNSSQV